MEKIPQKKFDAKVLNTEDVAQGVRKITFKTNDTFLFLSGQYVWVEINGSRRAFSVLNDVNNDNKIEIIARISDSDYKKKLFKLKSGDSVIIHGPFGNSYVVNEKHQPKNIIMIAGGVGVSPFLSVIKMIKSNSYEINCYLVYLNNNLETTPFLNELDDFKKNNTFFDYINTYKYFHWNDFKDIFKTIKGSKEWWLSGSASMINHVYKELEIGGISKKDMFFENFYPTQKNNLTRDIALKQLSDGNLFSKAIQNSTNHLVVTDVNGIVLFANKAAENITGYTNDEIIGNTPRLWGGMMSQEFYIDFWKKILSGESFRGEIMNRRKNGDIYYAIAHISPIIDNENKLIGFMGTEEDITDRKNFENKLIATQEKLKAVLAESEHFNRISVDRELKMIELKEKIIKLESQKNEK